MDRKAVKELISVYIYMKKGDSHLVWPFQGNITVQLINQKEGEENLEKKLVKAGSSIACVSEGNTAKVGRGLCEFLSHTDLYNPEEGKEYLKNDMLIFKITEVEVTSL